MADTASMWRYVHARTVARLMPHLKKRVPDRSQALQRFLRQSIDARHPFSILQIGAFDGVSNDPVHELIRAAPHVRAVLLEPQPVPFATLQHLWREHPRVVPLQAALAAECGERSLFVLAGDAIRLHPYAGQVASFLHDRVETECRRYVWRPSPDMVAAVPVTTVDWRTLVAAHGVFDFVAIDAEGYDAEILRLIDLSVEPPGIILYEHCHLTRRVRRACADRLRQAGYRVRQVNKADTLATRFDAPEF